jgi:ribonuclease D
MTEEVLGMTLSKKAKLTNWEAQDFTPEQKLYAATDAWIGRLIYLSLMK